MIEFRAILPAIQGAIKVSPQDGVRIQLEVPEMDKVEALKLSVLGGKVLTVRITVDD